MDTDKKPKQEESSTFFWVSIFIIIISAVITGLFLANAISKSRSLIICEVTPEKCTETPP